MTTSGRALAVAVVGGALLAGCSTPPPWGQPTAELNEQVEWTDQDGFSYRIETTEFFADVEVDTERSAPGTAEVTFEFLVRGDVHNTTADRVAPFPSTGLTIRPVWDEGSLACSGRPESFFDDGSYDVPGRACSVLDDGMPFRAPGTVEIPHDGSVTAEADSGYEQTLIFDEGDGAQAAEVLRSPDRWVLVSPEGH